jgi:hypothetical protein
LTMTVPPVVMMAKVKSEVTVTMRVSWQERHELKDRRTAVPVMMPDEREERIVHSTPQSLLKLDRCGLRTYTFLFTWHF